LLSTCATFDLPRHDTHNLSGQSRGVISETPLTKKLSISSPNTVVDWVSLEIARSLDAEGARLVINGRIQASVLMCLQVIRMRSPINGCFVTLQSENLDLANWPAWRNAADWLGVVRRQS